MEKLKQEIRKMIVEIGNISEDLIVDTALLETDLLIDSLTFVKIITEIEEMYQIEFPTEEMELSDNITFEEFCNKALKMIAEK